MLQSPPNFCSPSSRWAKAESLTDLDAWLAESMPDFLLNIKPHWQVYIRLLVKDQPFINTTGRQRHANQYLCPVLEQGTAFYYSFGTTRWKNSMVFRTMLSASSNFAILERWFHQYIQEHGLQFYKEILRNQNCLSLLSLVCLYSNAI